MTKRLLFAVVLSLMVGTAMLGSDLGRAIPTRGPPVVFAGAAPSPQGSVHAPPGYTPVPGVLHRVSPTDTDSAIDDALQPHLAGVTSCAQDRGYLVVFLPGTGGRPTSPYVVNMLNVATQNCLDAIALNYPDDSAVWETCYRDKDPDCYEKWRLEKLDGIHRSPYLHDVPADSIENRLLKLLQFLASNYPQEGWGQYLNGDSVQWEDVIASGDSQGGGMAAIVGQVHEVARVAMFAAVTDAIGGFNGPAPAWTSKPKATPADRFFGFAHMDDQWWPAEQKNWAALNLTQFGAVVNVDNATAPYDGSHMLTTDIAWDHSMANGAHPAVVSPLNTGTFAPVWAYLLGPN